MSTKDVCYALAHGWTAEPNEDTPGLYWLMPADCDDPRRKWASKWQKQQFGSGTLMVPHWFGSPEAPLKLV